MKYACLCWVLCVALSCAQAHDVFKADEEIAIYRGYVSSSNNMPGDETIPINQATIEVLKSLPGVGPKTAALIHAYLQDNPCDKLEDLLQIKSIGPKKLQKMKPYVMCQ